MWRFFFEIYLFWYEAVFDLRIWLTGDDFLRHRRDIGVVYNNWLLLERGGGLQVRRVGVTLGEAPSRIEWRILNERLRWRRIELEKASWRQGNKKPTVPRQRY